MNHCDRATITTKRAAEIMDMANCSMGIPLIQAGIEQKELPFGICIVRNQREFYLYKKPLAEWIYKQCGVKVDFNGELVSLTFDDGIISERLCDDGIVRTYFDAHGPEKMQVAV